MAFPRQYVCKSGFATSEYTDTAKPWSNNIGSGWTHNLNIHLKTSTPTASGYPLTVIVYDETGEARTFARSTADSTATEDVYYRSLAVFPEEKRQTLVRDKTAGTYIPWLAENSRYEFSAPTTTADRFARLESIVDANGNSLTMEYNGAAGTGKLIKAHAPTGDTRFLEFTYTGNLITQVALMKGTTQLARCIYTYDVNDELTGVQDPGENTLAYTYATHGSVPASRYLSQLTDKKAVATDIAWDFSYVTGPGYLAYRITIDTDDGRSTVYERSQTTDIATAITCDGATAENKYVYTPVGATGMPWHVDHYLDGSSSNFERWSYGYAADGYTLEQILGPASTVLANYTLDTLGRPEETDDVTGHGPVLTYASADDPLPTTIDRRDGKSVTVTYDANGRIENTLETGVANGTTDGYSTYGQIATVTDPLDNDTIYTYDDMGNLLTRTDAVGTTTYTYDLLGRLESKEYPDGRVADYAYDHMGRVLSEDDGLADLPHTYDSFGNVLTETSAANNTTTNTYNAQMRKTQEVDGVGTRTYAYDNVYDRLTSVTDELSQTTTVTAGSRRWRTTPDAAWTIPTMGSGASPT